jgi:hypothetical protein
MAWLDFTGFSRLVLPVLAVIQGVYGELSSSFSVFTFLFLAIVLIPQKTITTASRGSMRHALLLIRARNLDPISQRTRTSSQIPYLA